MDYSDIPIPAIIDQLDDRVNKDYVAHPDRLYLVGKDGKIAYAGAKGPRGFKPDELEQAMMRELSGEAPTTPPAEPSAEGGVRLRPRSRCGWPAWRRRGTPPGRPDPERMFQRMDADGDGKLTKEELPPGMLRRWQRMDANGDGVVDQQEQAAIIMRFRRASGGEPE